LWATIRIRLLSSTSTALDLLRGSRATLSQRRPTVNRRALGRPVAVRRAPKGIRHVRSIGRSLAVPSLEADDAATARGCSGSRLRSSSSRSCADCPSGAVRGRTPRGAGGDVVHRVGHRVAAFLTGAARAGVAAVSHVTPTTIRAVAATHEWCFRPSPASLRCCALAGMAE